MLLTFSGFLSEKDSPYESWRDINDYMEAQGSSCFEVKWDSVHYNEIAKSLALGIGKFALQEGISMFANGGP